MKLFHLLLYLITASVLVTSCQKELSYESGSTPSAGTLQSDVTGDCLPKTVVGVYEVGTALDVSTDYIDVQVDVTKAGSYTITTDTVAGISFKGTGTFASNGTNTVRLVGTGTPTVEGIQNFTVRYDGSTCSVPITIQAAGSVVEAVFTLAGNGGDCMSYVPAGDYIAGTPTTAANTVTINVNVTSAGTYNISTTLSNGFSFAGSGTLTAAPAQTITLTASGTPAAVGTSNFPITAGASSCNFAINVTATASTADYFPRTEGSNWRYQHNGDANDTLMLRAKAGTVVIGGNTYTMFEGTTDAATTGFQDFGAFSKVASDYHSYFDLADYFVIDNPAPVDYVFIKDNVAAGTIWRSNPVTIVVSGATAYLRIVLQVEQKDVALTVGGIGYTDVIVVKESYEMSSVAATGPFVDVTSAAGYVRRAFARNIGMILEETHDPDGSTNPPVTDLLELTRHEIH